MMRKHRELIKQINDGKNLETVVPLYADEMSTLLYEYSLLQAAMEFYSLSETLQEVEQFEEDRLSIITPLRQWVKEVLATKENGLFREIHIQQLDVLRTLVMEKMDVLTMYADQLEIYEYVLNRKEYEFLPAKEVMEDTEFAAHLYQYIFSSKDNVQINRNIQQAVAQLPVRMLKSKYFEYLKDSFLCYKDAEKSGVDTFIYMLRTSGMVYQAKNKNKSFTSLGAQINRLKKVDYTNLTKKKYNDCCKLLKDTANAITVLSDFHYQVEKVINQLYIYLLVRPYALSVNEKVEVNCKKILTTTLEHLDSNSSQMIEEKLVALFDDLLGIQEQHMEDYLILSGGLPVIKEGLWEMTEELSINSQMESLYLADKLCNNSVFMDIHQEVNDHKVTWDYLEHQLNQLIHDLSELFSQNPQCINRAVIAATLSKLPVFFNNAKEVQDYIANSLSQCQNEAEKAVAKDLLLSMMASEED